MTSIRPFFAVLVALSLTAGCATPRLQTPEGFPRLTVDPGDESTLVFTKPDLDLRSYRKVYLEPVRIQGRNLDKDEVVTSAEANELAVYMEERVAAALAKDFERVSAPGPGVLRMRFTITDLLPTSAAQAVMLVPPFSVINMVSPKGAFVGSITLAGEFFEETAAQPSVAFVAYRSRPGIDATVAFGRWSAARKVINMTAERIARDLVALRGDPPPAR